MGYYWSSVDMGTPVFIPKFSYGIDIHGSGVISGVNYGLSHVKVVIPKLNPVCLQKMEYLPI